jgi:hexosaminidase
MNKYSFIAAALAALCASACAPKTEIDVIPAPAKVTLGKGSFNVAGAVVSYDGASVDARTARHIADFAAELTAVTGKESVVEDTLQEGGISFAFNTGLANEEYTLDITKSGVKAAASTFNGFLYAIVTLKEMLPVEIFDGKLNQEVSWTLPYASIDDKPRFAYRGMHLDVCRHFFTVDEVKKYLDVMALHKMNTFHWHLTEDQGWRIEIKSWPKLTEVGAYRNSTMVGHYVDGVSEPQDSIRYGGFYTQDQLRDVVAYAADLGITVMPEIDLPGHMVAALASYPELGCTGGPYEVRTTWGIADDVLCPGKEITFKFIEDVLTEVMDIFPSEYICIGGDECPKVRWEKCPDCQKRIAELGLKSDSTMTAEQYLQNYVTSRVQKFVNSKGRKITGWDEILEGNLDEGATVMSWRGVKGGIEAAKRGFDAIMVPTTYLYFDYYQSKETDKEPLSIGGYLPIDSVYSYEPLKGIPEEDQSHILGVQANLWTEYIATPEHLEYMLLPRLDALSELQWCQPEAKDFARFKKSLVEHQFAIYDKLGYTYSKDVIGIYGMPEGDKD